MVQEQREQVVLPQAEDLWLLDTLFLGEPGVIASYLLTGDSGLALIDVGPASTVETLLAGVRAAGFDPLAIRHLVLTHIHLDHAGAAGTLARMLPGAQVYVHRVGAPHLMDPTKLVASARRIYGERMDSLWGAIEPVPAARLTLVEDGDELHVGGRILRALYTPGHAVHHLAYLDAKRHALFAGDVAGVRLVGSALVRPPTPPPDLNIEDWDRSLTRLEALDPEVLYLAHFGRFTNAQSHIVQLRDRLHAWADLMLSGIRAGKSDVELAQMLEGRAREEAVALAPGEREALLRRYEVASNVLMGAQGFMRYFAKVHPELLTA